MLFGSWEGLLRVLVSGALAYPALVLVLRISGKRTLAKMNAFDLVVTVSLGSTLATVLLSKDVLVAEGVVAFALLAALQFVVAWMSLRFKWAEAIAKSAPRVLLRDGRIDGEALRDERVTADEVLAAIRSSGIGDQAMVAAVVLETDGSFSVISQRDAGTLEALPGNGPGG